MVQVVNKPTLDPTGKPLAVEAWIKAEQPDGVVVSMGGQIPNNLAIRLHEAGIPIVGHLGLTPQTAGMLGGYKVQGKDAASATRIYEDALGLQAAGAFMLWLAVRLLSRRLTGRVVRAAASNTGRISKADLNTVWFRLSL